MIDNPIYNGDYIAQAKAEVIQFLLILDSVEKQKAMGQEYERGNIVPMDVESFPSYSFHHFQKYTDEKLSSANPQIYIPDLDELFMTIQKCISKYCKIIEMKITEVQKLFADHAFFDPNNLTMNNLIFFKQAKFCFLIRSYYKSKRKLIDFPFGDSEEKIEENYMDDKEKLLEILGQDFASATDEDLNIFLAHILFFKYHGNQPKKLPDIHLICVSQRKLIKKCISIVKYFNWDSKGRDHLANIFGYIIKEYENFKPIRYNRVSIRKSMY